MSNVNKRVQRHSATSKRPPRTVEEEDGMEVDEAEEAIEVNGEEDMEDEDDAPLSLHAGRSKNLAEMAQKIILELKLSEGDPETRETAKLLIRKMYIDNGGLPFNSKDPIPHNLENLSDQELGFVMENMIIHLARTQKSEIIARATNTVSNVAFFMTGEEDLVTQINSDSVLRQALLDTFLGSRISPLLTLLISASSHVTNLIRTYIVNGKRSTKPTTTTQTPATQQTTNSAVPPPQSYDSGFRAPQSSQNK